VDYKAYLAGPVTGLSYEAATEWRQYARKILAYLNIDAMDPMRGQEYLAGSENMSDSYEGLPMSTQRAIMAKSYNDAVTANILIVNFLGATRVSIGTVMEMAWAYEKRIPVICIMEAEGNPHDHSMVRDATNFRVASIDEALKVADVMLNGKPRYSAVMDWVKNGTTKLPPKG
jgi:nucleoside 2-deoxyribosyltransferase